MHCREIRAFSAGLSGSGWEGMRWGGGEERDQVASEIEISSQAAHISPDIFHQERQSEIW